MNLTHFVEWIILPVAGAIIAIPITLLFSEPINEILAKVYRGLSDKRRNISGIWTASYTRLDTDGIDPVTESIRLRQIGNRVIGKRVNDKNYRLEGKLREGFLTGTWYDPRNNSFYHGAFQFVLDDGGQSITGRWVGFSSNRKNIRFGDWNLTI